MSDSAGATRQLKRRDRITVEKDGEEIEVFNWATTREFKRFRPGDVEMFSPDVWAGDAEGKVPEAITVWLAEELRDDGIRFDSSDIDVIDPTDDEVIVL